MFQFDSMFMGLWVKAMWNTIFIINVTVFCMLILTYFFIKTKSLQSEEVYT